TVGGIAIIAAVVAILLLILGVALPLFGRTSVTLEPRTIPAGASADELLAVGLDDYSTLAYAVTRGGEAVFYNVADGTERERIDLGGGGTRLTEVQTWGNIYHALIWEDGRVTFASVSMRPVFDDAGQRSIEHKLEILSEVPGPDAGRPVRTVA